MSTSPTNAVRRGPEPPDLSEKGGVKNGQTQRSDDRLLLQFLAFGDSAEPGPLTTELRAADVTGVLYEDMNDPRGVALLTLSQDPNVFLARVRPLLNGRSLQSLQQQAEYTRVES